MLTSDELKNVILERKNSLKTDKLDMSFGELMNMYEEGVFMITPEYQRAFRWDMFQQTRFIESILLGIPIPPIYVAVDADGKWELVDGLQRISTLFSFFGILKAFPEKNGLVLSKGDIIEEIEGYTSESLPVVIKVAIKRAICRVEVLKSDSDIDMRYQLFNRLNRGSCPLTEQEIRNCIFRGYGNELNQILIDFSKNELFKKIIQPTAKQIEEMYCEELVLHYFAFKYYGLVFKRNLQSHLSEFMKAFTKKEIEFDAEKEKERFYLLLGFLNKNSDYKVFRGANGVFSPTYYDAIILMLDKYYEKLSSNPKDFANKVKLLKKNVNFRDISSKSTAKDKMTSLIEIADNIFRK